MRFIVTWGTRVDLIEADDETMARCLWIDRHRPDWWEQGVERPYDRYEGVVSPKRGGVRLDPDLDLHVRAATPADIERLTDLREQTTVLAGKRGWR